MRGWGNDLEYPERDISAVNAGGPRVQGEQQHEVLVVYTVDSVWFAGVVFV